MASWIKRALKKRGYKAGSPRALHRLFSLITWLPLCLALSGLGAFGYVVAADKYKVLGPTVVGFATGNLVLGALVFLSLALVIISRLENFLSVRIAPLLRLVLSLISGGTSNAFAVKLWLLERSQLDEFKLGWFSVQRTYDYGERLDWLQNYLASIGVAVDYRRIEAAVQRSTSMEDLRSQADFLVSQVLAEAEAQFRAARARQFAIDHPLTINDLVDFTRDHPFIALGTVVLVVGVVVHCYIEWKGFAAALAASRALAEEVADRRAAASLAALSEEMSRRAAWEALPFLIEYSAWARTMMPAIKLLNDGPTHTILATLLARERAYGAAPLRTLHSSLKP